MPYLNMALNSEVRETIVARSKIISFIRRYMEDLDFVEVETPTLHHIFGGASAKPFETYHNDLEAKMFLRVAPELFLKKLLVGGMTKVFEIGKNFRNEGVSSRHNPEFTAIEFYQAFANYKEHMDLVEDLIVNCAQKDTITWYGHKISLSEAFRRTTVKEEVRNFLDVSEGHLQDSEFLLSEMKRLGVSIPLGWTTVDHLVYSIFETCCEELLIQPTFVTEYPTVVSPLARQSPENPAVTERFELFIAGKEIANGFNELNDPEEQWRRFLLQEEERSGGNEEGMMMDKDYIKALEFGMPPAAGTGIGIDRLVMFLLEKDSIREVIAFPHRRENNE
jgi:lysyl-tRNA synthetase class 2